MGDTIFLHKPTFKGILNLDIFAAGGVFFGITPSQHCEGSKRLLVIKSTSKGQRRRYFRETAQASVVEERGGGGGPALDLH
jgi:hypothetical protein